MAARPPPPGKKAAAQRAAFVQEYLVDLNGPAAAIRAGYSERRAKVTASELMTRPDVKEAVTVAMQKRADRVEVKQDDVLRELLRIARVDLSEAYDDEGRLKSLKDMPEDVRRAIAGIEVEELFEGDGDGGKRQIGQLRKVKFWDKNRALEMLMRHLGAFRDKVEVEHRVTLEDLVLAADQKLKASGHGK